MSVSIRRSQKISEKAEACPNDNFSCWYCDFKSNSKTAIDSHLSTHVFQKPMHYCPECDFSADRPSSVVNHIIKIHADTTNNLSGKSMNCSKSTASMSIASPLLQCKPNDFEEPTVLAANNEQIAVKQINNNGTSKYTPKIKSIKSRVLSFDIKESQEKSVNLVARVRNRGTLKCPICEKNFLNKFTLKHHVHLHKINERKCNLCNFTCDRKKLMRMHMEMHLKKGFLCDHCSEMFISSQDKIKHMQVSHKDSVKPFSCTLCSFSCDFERSLFMHNLRSHREALKLNTPEGKPPKNHKNKNPFICDVCNYSTHYKTNFMQHYRIHTGEKPFKCSYCPYSAIQRSSLMAHLTRHTLEHKFQCTKCYSKFRLSGHLKRHMEKHSARKSFFCDVCDKSFKSKNNMESHKKLHSVEKHCVTCNRYFLYSRAFKVHMKSHANPNKRKKKFPLKCKTQSNFINLKSTKLVSKNCRRKSQESTKTETQDSSAESAVRGNIFDIFSSYINVPQGSYKKSPEDKALVDSPMDTENNFVVRDGIFGNVAYDKNSVSLPIKDPLESNQTLESVKQKCVTSFSVTSINHVIINLKRQHTKNEKTLEKKCCKRKSEKQMVWSNIKQTKIQNLEKSTGDLQTTKSSSSQSPVSTMETSGVHNKDKYINLDSNSLVVKKKRGRPPGKLSLNTPKMNTEKSSDTEMLQLDNCTSSTKPVCASNNFTTMLAYSPCKEKGVLDSSSELSVSVVCKRRGRPPRSQFPHQNCNTPKSDAKNAADVNSQMMSLPNCTSSKDLLSATNSSVNKAHSEDPNSLVVHKKRGRPPRKLSSNQDFNPPIPNAKKTSDSGMLPPSNYMNYTTNMEPANTRVDIHVGANGLEITELNKKKSGKRRKKEEDIHFHKNNHKDSKLPSMVEHDLASDYETGDENSSVNTSKLHIKLPLNTNCTNSISENEVKECTFCTVKFDSRKALRSHMKVHRELSSYTCKVCGESFPFRASLKLHSKDNHSNELANMTKTDHPQTSHLVTSNPTNPQIPLNIEIIDSLLCDLLQPLKESYSASQKLANKNAILNAIVGEENEPMNKLTSLITSNKYNFLEVNHKFCVSENIKSNVNMEKHCAAENSRVIDRLNSEDVLKQHKSGPNMDMLNSVKINSSELDKGNKQCLFERNQWCINNVNGTAAEDASPVGDAMCSIGGRDQQIDESSGEMVQVSVGQESLSDREMVQTAVGDDECVSNEEIVQTAVGDDETVSNEMVQTAVGDDETVSNEEMVQTAVGDDETVSNGEMVQTAVGDDETVSNEEIVQTAVGDDETVSNEEMVQTAVGDDETVSNEEMVQTAVGDDETVNNEEMVQTAVGDDESVSNEELVQDELVENQQSKEPISYIDLIRPYMRIYSQEELEMLSSLNE